MKIANPFANSNKYRNKRLHLGVSGSIACYKACELLRSLLKLNIHVSATLSAGAKKFITASLFKALGAFPVYEEMFCGYEEVFAHLEPGHNCDAMLIAPASANSIARICHGFASDMLSAQALAFTGGKAFAPAMNAAMWENKTTQANVKLLIENGWELIAPASGQLADGDTGYGRLAPITEIFFRSLKLLSPNDLSGLKVMVTLGPTREDWDAARFWTNGSTGKMGAALATACWLRGAEVYAICGPGVEITLPASVQRINVRAAKEMLEAAQKIWPEMDWGIFCAAVCDFAPQEGNNNIKIKKDAYENGLSITFKPCPDILKTLAQQQRAGQKILGFAAETCANMHELLELAQIKLKAKHAQLVAANLINPDCSAFGASGAALAVVDCNGQKQIWPEQPKADLAWELCTWLLKI